MKQPSMPPPGAKKPTLAIAIGIPKSDGSAKGADSGDGGDDDSGKASPEAAIVIRADQHCRQCSNYQPQTGKCSEVSGYLDPEDSCYKYFEPIGGSGDGEEPDEDDQK